MLNQNDTAILVAIVDVLSTIVGSLLTILGNYPGAQAIGNGLPAKTAARAASIV
jgi:hypothetical protein